MVAEANDRDSRLDDVIAAYLQAVECGTAPERSVLLERYPDLADDLRAFFADFDQIDQATAPLRASNPAAPVPADLRHFGDYELLEEIGCGGMGVVYKARQISLNRIVALKRIRAGQLASPEEVARFLREAKAAAGLDHPHIVPIYEIGEQQGQHYFTMKLFEGGNLATFSRDPKGSADQRNMATLMVQIAQAVHHAHQRGILHRDLKPSNILLDGDGQPHVGDFGLAQPLEREGKLTQSGAIVGTPEYMAPEQARGEKGLTTAADVYGLGAILYFLLTGRPPFQGDYNWETLKKVVEEEPVTPRSHNKAVNRDLERICLKCLEKNPKKRFQSAADLGEDLENWLHGRPLRHVRPVGKTEKVLKWVKRHPVATAFGFVLLGVLGLLFQIWSQRTDSSIAGDIAAKKLADMELEKAKSDWLALFSEAKSLRRDGQRWEALVLLKKCADHLHDQPDFGNEDLLRHEAFFTVNTIGSRRGASTDSGAAAVAFNADESKAAILTDHSVYVIDLIKGPGFVDRHASIFHRPHDPELQGGWNYHFRPVFVKWKNDAEIIVGYRPSLDSHSTLWPKSFAAAGPVFRGFSRFGVDCILT